MKAQHIAGFSIIAVILFFINIKFPVPTKENSVKITGKIIKIYEGGAKDIVFELENDKKNIYYINRGFENAIKPDSITRGIYNKEADIWNVNHRNIFDPANNSRHISKLDVNGNYLFRTISFP